MDVDRCYNDMQPGHHYDISAAIECLECRANADGSGLMLAPYIQELTPATSSVPSLSVQILRAGVVVYSIVVYGANLSYRIVS
jgi:hypothetical protein